jgi:NADH-quinone oxidoreductase subunit C
MNLEAIKAALESEVSGCRVEIVQNGSPSAQHSLLMAPEHALDIALHLRDAEMFCFDYCSNVTGIDWSGREITEKIKVRHIVDGVEQEVEESRKRESPAYLEAVYHLYSTQRRIGPLILRVRTTNRTDQVHLPSLTAVWRSAEFQEREIFDLFGIIFDGHPDMRRLLMWDGFMDHPMRKDYIEPDDYEYEPTAHDDVLKKAKVHQGGPGLL